MPEPLMRRLLRMIDRTIAEPDATALVLGGGGARAAYQAGVARYIAEQYSDAAIDIVTGVSAGAINAAQIASSASGPRSHIAEDLCEAWRKIDGANVFESVSSAQLIRSILGLTTGQSWIKGKPMRALVDTEPLRAYLVDRLETDEDGVLTAAQRNVDDGHLRCFALSTTDYGTGEHVTWYHSNPAVRSWERQNRIGRPTTLTLDHLMASTALPFVFPAICVEGSWHGDGGIRQAAPLSPAIHLGATRVLSVTTRYDRSSEEAGATSLEGYPPASQIMSVLFNAVFLDVLDQDLNRFERVNELLEKIPRSARGGMRPIRLLSIRPSRDLGQMAAQFNVSLDGALGWIAGGLGGESESPDWLSMILFDGGFAEQLMDLGYEDGRTRRADLDAFFAD
jgi:NTE family protein